MPIIVRVVRTAWCCICDLQWELGPGEKPDETCRYCGSREWELGPECTATRLIRQGITRLRKPLNPGATSLKRREHGRRQYRQFKEKPVEPNSPDVGQ